MWAGRPFFIRIGVSQASLAPASSSAAITAGQTRGSRSSTLVSSSSEVAGRGRSAAASPTRSRSTLAWPSGSRPPAPTPIAVVVIARLRAPRGGDRGQQRGAGRRAQLHGRGARRAGVRRDAAEQLGDRGRRDRERAVGAADRAGADGDRADDDPVVGRGGRSRRTTPTTSAIASRAPTSWKCDVERVVAVDAGLGDGQPLEDARARGRATGSSRSALAEQRPDVAPGAVVAESATSTWQRVAARPLRVDLLDAERDRLGRDRVDGALQHVDAVRRRRRSAPSSMSPLAPEEASTQTVMASRARRLPGDPGGEHARAVAVVDVDDGHAGRAGVEHRQQRGEAAERRAVPDAGRHRDQRYAGQPADHGRQRALHAGDDDEAVGVLEPVADVEQPVQPGHADVVDRVRPRRRGPARSAPPRRRPARRTSRR